MNLKHLFEYMRTDKMFLLLVYCKNRKRLESFFLQGTLLQLIATNILDVIVDKSMPGSFDITLKLSINRGVNGSTANVNNKEKWQGIHLL